MPEETAISVLPEALTPDGTERLPMDQDGQTVQSTLAALVAGAMEYGSGTDSEYVRLPNGLQVCWGRAGSTTSGETASIEFPAAFSSAPRVVVTPVLTPNELESTLMATSAVASVSSGGFSHQAWSGADLGTRTRSSRSAGYIAIGTWS